MKSHIGRIPLFLAILLLVSTVKVKGQAPPALKEEPKQFAIRIGVEEVRIDGVVLDNKGHQIPYRRTGNRFRNP
jgi:hypothetical protein